MADAVKLWPSAVSKVAVGGTSVAVAYGPINGGLIVNPSTPADQGVAVPEPLYVSFTGPAGLAAGGGTFAVQPGGYFPLPALSGNVTVNARTAGHAFSAIVFQTPTAYVPPSAAFPPSGTTTLTNTIPSYLYQEYNDDDALQAFVDAYNSMSQEYVDWFAQIGLPIYTGLSGSLLDWIGAGLYGLARPSLPSGSNYDEGPPNTWPPNAVTPNEYKIVGNQTFYATSDDVYKRILTWHFFKGDGKYAAVDWLKRRVVRFLTGTDGIDPGVGDTYRVSVTFGNDGTVNITILNGTVAITGGAIPGAFAPNSKRPNELDTTFAAFPEFALASIFKAAVDSGVIELPFQFTYAVGII